MRGELVKLRRKMKGVRGEHKALVKRMRRTCMFAGATGKRRMAYESGSESEGEEESEGEWENLSWGG